MNKGILSLLLTVMAAFVIVFGYWGLSAKPTKSETSSIPAETVELEAVYRKISAQEAKDMMAVEDRELILLDVRTLAEWQEGHIPGSVLIPDTEIAERAKGELPDRDALILIYCRSGRRSALAAQELVSQGYTNVHDFGGILDWPFEVVTAK